MLNRRTERWVERRWGGIPISPRGRRALAHLGVREEILARAIRTQVCAAILCGFGVAGCTAPEGGTGFAAKSAKPVDVRSVGVSDNIVQIVKFWPREPWVRFRRDIAPAVDGIRTASVFLVDGATRKGMFGDGTIIVDMYQIEADEEGYEVAEKVYTWSFDAEEAMPFRSRKRTVQGWGYQLRLHWEDLDLAGQEIELRISFRRLDGQVVNSSGQRFRVPAARARRRRANVAAVPRAAPPKPSPTRRAPGGSVRSASPARPTGTSAPATRPARVGPASRPAIVPRTKGS